MKKVAFLFIAFALVFGLVGMKPQAAYAQGFGVSWDSSFQVLNLSETDDAHIQMYYYLEDGTLAPMDTGYTNPDSDTVLVGESNTYFPVHAAAGFNGAVVVSSDQPIAVISNLVVMTEKRALGSYVAFQQGASKIYFPLVMKENPSPLANTTSFNVQNTGADSVDITITFTPEPGKGYANIADVTDTIPMGAAHSFDLSNLDVFSGVGKWVGSATVVVTDVENDSIAGVANTVNMLYNNAFWLATYNAFTGGTETVVLPLIQENNNQNRTSVNCQNIGGATTDVTVTYTPEAGSPAKPSETKTGIVANGVAVFLQDFEGPVKFVGSAEVSADQPLVCVVNQQRPPKGYLSAYEGFNPVAGDTVVLPLIQSKNGDAVKGWVYSSINLATVDGQAHQITCDYRPAPGFDDPADDVDTGASVVFLNTDMYGNGTKFIGGAVCSTDDGTGLLAIVNQTREANPDPIRDVLSSYDGFNQ